MTEKMTGEQPEKPWFADSQIVWALVVVAVLTNVTKHFFGI